MNDESEKDYFNLTQKRRQERKGARQQAHKEAVKAARDGKLAELVGTVGEDGKRAINYQILKNKGLTPKRKKDDRNSRVKKRKKYEKAQKSSNLFGLFILVANLVFMKVKRQVLKRI